MAPTHEKGRRTRGQALERVRGEVLAAVAVAAVDIELLMREGGRKLGGRWGDAARPLPWRLREAWLKRLLCCGEVTSWVEEVVGSARVDATPLGTLGVGAATAGIAVAGGIAAAAALRYGAEEGGARQPAYGRVAQERHRLPRQLTKGRIDHQNEREALHSAARLLTLRTRAALPPRLA